MVEQRVAEQLGLRHELNPPPHVDRGEEVVHLAEVVGRDDRRALVGDVVVPDRSRSVDEDGGKGEDDPDEVVDVADPLPRSLMEAREVLGGARVLVDLRLQILWIDLGHISDCTHGQHACVMIPTRPCGPGYGMDHA